MSKKYEYTIWHGEHKTLYYIVHVDHDGPIGSVADREEAVRLCEQLNQGQVPDWLRRLLHAGQCDQEV